MVQHHATTVWHFSAFHYNKKSGKVFSQTSPDFFTSSLLYQLPLTDSAATAPFHSMTPHHAPFAGHTPWPEHTDYALENAFSASRSISCHVPDVWELEAPADSFDRYTEYSGAAIDDWRKTNMFLRYHLHTLPAVCYFPLFLLPRQYEQTVTPSQTARISFRW